MSEKHRSAKERILDAFLEIYARKPLSEIFVSEICKNCGVSRGTFYYYYSDVYDLCEQLEQAVIDDMEADLNQTMMSAMGRNRSASDARFIRAYAKSLEKYIPRQRLYQCLLTGSHGVQFHQAWTESVTRKFAEPFGYTDAPNTAFPLICRFFGGGLVTMLAHWLNHGCVETPEEIAAATDQIMFLGTFSAGDSIEST